MKIIIDSNINWAPEIIRNVLSIIAIKKILSTNMYKLLCWFLINVQVHFFGESKLDYCYYLIEIVRKLIDNDQNLDFINQFGPKHFHNSIKFRDKNMLTINILNNVQFGSLYIFEPVFKPKYNRNCWTSLTWFGLI